MPNPGLQTLLTVLALGMLPLPPIQAEPLLGPKTYTRSTGQPNNFLEHFSNCEPQARYKLVVQNGNLDGSQRASSAMF